MRNGGKPQLAIDGGGDYFAADDDHQREPVGVANGEAGPGMEVHFGVEAEGTRGRVGYGHFRESPHYGESDQRADSETDDDRGAGEFYGDGAAEEQAGADRGAESDHGHLAGRQAAVQAFFLVGEIGVCDFGWGAGN